MVLGNIFYAVVALAFVLGLFGLMALMARKFGLGYPMTGSNLKGRKRLSLVESMPLDAKRRLVLLKRDNAEHLVILGVSSELLIESVIPAADKFTDSTDMSAASLISVTKEKTE